MLKHDSINYIEWPAKDIGATRAFFETVFGWQFTEYGPDYIDFQDAAINGGFYRAELASTSESGGALVVFYSEDLAATQTKIEAAGGSIVKPVFAFPGGRRFHFCEPSGNEFAVWSDKA